MGPVRPLASSSELNRFSFICLVETHALTYKMQISRNENLNPVIILNSFIILSPCSGGSLVTSRCICLFLFFFFPKTQHAVVCGAHVISALAPLYFTPTCVGESSCCFLALSYTKTENLKRWKNVLLLFFFYFCRYCFCSRIIKYTHTIKLNFVIVVNTVVNYGPKQIHTM